jgi:sulfate adenylyltransferase subunit 1
MDETPMDLDKTYDIKRATSVVPGFFEHINYKVDVNTYERETVHKLGLNDIASCKMLLTQPIAADAYEMNRLTGSFIVVDRITNNTVGAGMIVGVSRREQDAAKLAEKHYTDAERALNKYIREHFPEWECKTI